MLRIGNHLPSSKGYLAMGKHAVKLGATTFAFFTRNPRGGTAKPINEADVQAFLAYAKEHGLPITAGSDQHTTRMIGGGMLFDRKLSDEKDFCRAVLAGEAKAYWNGSEFDG